MTEQDKVIDRLVESGIHLDTYPDHWRCAKCEQREPHFHRERIDGRFVARDYGYDERDE